MIAPHDESYRNFEEYEVIIFNMLILDDLFSLRRQQAAWGKYARKERLIGGHVALVVRPGGAQGLAR